MSVVLLIYTYCSIIFSDAVRRTLQICRHLSVLNISIVLSCPVLSNLLFPFLFPFTFATVSFFLSFFFLLLVFSLLLFLSGLVLLLLTSPAPLTLHY